MGRRLDNLEIVNFRQFHELKLNFDKPGDNDMSVIIGGNRFGKTNIVNAILWCLYDKEAILREGSGDHPFIKNERYMDEETRVLLDLKKPSEDERINIERVDGTKTSIIKKTKDMAKYEPVDNPEIEIKKILPKSVRNFFLFKGEFLDDFIENANRGLLLDTIVKVSQLDVLKYIENSLNKLEDKYRKQISKKNRANKKLESLDQKIGDFKETIEKVQGRIKENEVEKRTNEKRINEISKRLQNLDPERVESLLSAEKQYTDSKERISNDIQDIKKDIVDIFIENISEWFLFEDYKELKDKLDEMESEGIIPPPITPALIDKILQQDKCIVCGSDIDEDTVERLRGMKNDVSSEKTKIEELYKLSVTLFFEKQNFSRHVDKLQKKMDFLSKKKEELEEVSEQLTYVTEELEEIDSAKNKEKMQKYNTERRLLKEKNEQLAAKISEDQASVDRMNMELDGLKIEFKKESSKASGTDKLNRKLDIASGLKTHAQNFYDEILSDIREYLNDKTAEYFKQMFWENYQYMNYDIHINGGFGLEVYTPEGNDISLFLSTGENKILALSFICALSDFYGFDFPIIIDAPFTELQLEVMMTVLDTLRTMSKEQQVIILTIPKHKELMEKLVSEANTVFKLQKNGSDDTIAVKQ